MAGGTEKPAVHYGYYLYNMSDELVYVGRTVSPKRRLTEARARYAQALRMEIKFQTTIFDKAQQWELDEIAAKRPLLNKVLVSSPSSLGYAHSKADIARMRATRSGVSKSPLHRMRIGLANLGRPVSAKTKIALDRTGKLHTLLTKERMSISRRGSGNGMYAKKHTEASKEKIRSTRADKMNLRKSGWAHPWRLATLTNTTRQIVEAY